jgi:hypothetical protein
MFEVVRVLRCVPHDLLWHAANVYTGPAQRAVLDYRRAGAVFSGTLRVRQAATTAADYQQIKLFCHVTFP